MSADQENNIETRVIELLEKAIDATDESEKVSFLNQAQEFVIHHGILDNFLDEILGFQNDRFSGVRNFVAGFIEATCKKEPDYFPKVIVNLNMILADQVAYVVKKAIQVLTQLYRVFLKWISQSKISDEIESTWEIWNQIKNYIFSLIDSTENDGVRTQCVKFIEMVIICQTKRDIFSADSEFSLTDILFNDNKLIDEEILEDEAKQLFEQLINFQNKIHISSVNLMATMQSLTLIARQRSKLFLNKVVHAFDKLSSNLPPTLAKSQVNSVKKQLKVSFILLLKHPYVYSSKQHTKLSQILLNIGASQSEINRCLQEVKKRGIKIETTHPIETKRIKVEDDEESNDCISAKESSKFNLDNALYELSKKFSRSDAFKAVDITAKDINPRLNDMNIVCDLILSSLHLLPDKINESAITTLNDINGSNQSLEIAKQLSFQLTSSGIGPGIDEITAKYIYSFESSNDVKMNSDISKKVTTLVKKFILKEIKNNKYSGTKVKLTQSGKSMTSAVKIKQMSLEDITKPMDLKNKLHYIEKSLSRILDDEKFVHFSSKQIETRHKIIGKFLSEFFFSDSIKSLIKNYILADIRNRYDILFNAIYFEFINAKNNSTSLDSYSSYLCWVIQNLIDSCELKDRDFFLLKFFIECPFLSENSLNLLKTFILSDESKYPDCFKSGIDLIKLLIEKRISHREKLSNILLQISIETNKIEVHNLALQIIKEIYQTEKLNLNLLIEQFALKHLNLLVNDCADKGICGNSESLPWNDESIKTCLSLYMVLLPLNQKLIHHLPSVYVSSHASIKRVILRLIQSSIQEIDMNSSEILMFVENCPAGAETLISRVIHILTEKKPPSTQLVSRVKDLYQKRVSDVRFLIPVLNGLSKKEIIAILPQLIKLNPIVVKEVFNRLLSSNVDSSVGFSNPISPADLLISLHNVDLSKCDLKTVIKATNLCFEDKNIYTAEVLAVVMQILVEQNPLPTLLMRTVIQTLSHYPRLIGFVMNNILQKLILKQVWNQKKVWEGFIKCCQRTMPQSFLVLLQLPSSQLKSVFDACPEIKPSLADHIQSLNEQQLALIPQALFDIVLVPNEIRNQPRNSSVSNEPMEQ